jgi:hypothetical protein
LIANIRVFIIEQSVPIWAYGNQPQYFPVVKNIFIRLDIEGDGLPIALKDVMPLLSFFGPSMLQNYLKGDPNNVN